MPSNSSADSTVRRRTDQGNPNPEAAVQAGYQRKGRRYRYYACGRAYRQGRASCPSRSIPAKKIESFVLDQIRAIGTDPELVAATVEESRRQLSARRRELEGEIRRSRDELDGLHADMRKAMTGVNPSVSGTATSRWDERRQEIATLEERLAGVESELAALRAARIDASDLRAALTAFAPVWDCLTSVERQKIVQTLIQRIEYDGRTGNLAITFAPEGVRMLAKDGVQAAEGSA